MLGDLTSSSTNGVRRTMTSSSTTGDNTGSTSNSSRRRRKLIILVGPEGISSNSINYTLDFFIHHMSPYRSQQHLPALQGWIWPAITTTATDDDNNSNDWEPVIPHRQMLDLLIQSNDDDLRLYILEQLNTTWAMTTPTNIYDRGMVLGSPMWDEDPTIVYEIVQFLNVPPEDVTVVFVYPASRYQQWFNLFQTNLLYENYTDYMCETDEIPFHIERLDTSMNLFHYSMAVASWGLNVVILDQRGMVSRQQSIPHTIACHIMTGVTCHNGWVEGVSPPSKEELDEQQQELLYSSSEQLSPISMSEQIQFEELLSDRDCYYRPYFMEHNPRFRHLFPDQLWSKCYSYDEPAMDKYYTSLVNTTFLWQLLQSNVDCPLPNDDDDIMNNNNKDDDQNVDFSNLLNDNTNSMAPTPVLTRVPEESSPLRSDVEQVESSLKSSIRGGMIVMILLSIILTLWILILNHRRRKRQQQQPPYHHPYYRRRRKREIQVLRQWNHDDDYGQIHRFDRSTIKACHVSGRYDDDEDDEDDHHHSFEEINLQQTHHENDDDEQHEQYHHNRRHHTIVKVPPRSSSSLLERYSPSSTPTTTTTTTTSSSSLSFSPSSDHEEDINDDNDFEEIDLQWMVNPNTQGRSTTTTKGVFI